MIKKIPGDSFTAYQGPEFDKGPLPALIYFAFSKEESLNQDPYNQPVQYLSSYPIRIFSFTLPFHGSSLKNHETMPQFFKSLQKDPQFFYEFLNACSQKIDQLITEKIIDPRFLSVAGLSRGVFFAAHLASINHHIKNILGFAPLTSVSYLSKECGDLSHFDLIHLTHKLIKKRVRFYIGNHDTRVGTTSCFNFIENLAAESYEKGIRSPEVELIISPSVGANGHGTLPPIFQDGANWILSTIKS